MIRACLIGFGFWGKNLARVLAASDRFDLAAVVDLPGSLDDAEKDFGGFDAVIIATPATTHADLALDALERGYHVLVEKPLALSAVHGEKLCAAARDAGRVLMVDHTYLYSPRFETVKFVLDLWGPWTVWRSTRTHSGGPADVSSLWDLLPHDLAMLHAAGFRARTVETTGDAESGCVDLTGVDGQRALLGYGRAAREKIRLIQVQTLAGQVTWDDRAEWPIRVKREVTQDLTVLGEHEPLAGLVDDFADAIGQRPCRYPARSTGVAAVYGLRVIEAAERSILSGRTEVI